MLRIFLAFNAVAVAMILFGVADKIVLMNSTILFGDDAYLIYASFDPLYISYWSGSHKCVIGLTAVFLYLEAKAWQPVVAECGECICIK